MWHAAARSAKFATLASAAETRQPGRRWILEGLGPREVERSASGVKASWLRGVGFVSLRSGGLGLRVSNCRINGSRAPCGPQRTLHGFIEPFGNLGYKTTTLNLKPSTLK